MPCPFWYNIFYQVKIVKLGRLEYEFIQYKGEPVRVKSFIKPTMFDFYPSTSLYPGYSSQEWHTHTSGPSCPLAFSNS